jgi:hypothetical protein
MAPGRKCLTYDVEDEPAALIRKKVGLHGHGHREDDLPGQGWRSTETARPQQKRQQPTPHHGIMPCIIFIGEVKVFIPVLMSRVIRPICAVTPVRLPAMLLTAPDMK